ncbi:MAG: fasciclin domain-containing protein [Planctomycetota bacterium]|nr:fasciclin domain-containing protein [Planctomycetota bacterium]
MKWFVSSSLAFVMTISLTIPAQAADIVETAVGAGKFNTLAAALKAAGLVETLQGKGPFTVFAPTDEAFAKLPEGTIATLLKPENKDALTGILTYHVVGGKVLAKDVVGLSGATTVNGQRVDIKVDGSTVMVDGAKVVATDIECDNGVIHVIDSVILPADKSIVATASGAGSFGTLLAAAKAAGLAGVLDKDGPLTVFAPTDEAFGKLPAGTVEALLKPENLDKLASILKYHVVAGRVYSDQAVKAKSAKTLEGSAIQIRVTDAGAMINDSKLITTDLDASNGVIHVIDAVLLPPAKQASARDVLYGAVSEGVVMFNAGHHAACADLYQQTLQGLMSTDMDVSMKLHMHSVLTSAKNMQCPTERAWALRRGIDQMFVSLPR